MTSKIGGSVGGGNWKYAHGTAHYGRNFSVKWLKVHLYLLMVTNFVLMFVVFLYYQDVLASKNAYVAADVKNHGPDKAAVELTK